MYMHNYLADVISTAPDRPHVACLSIYPLIVHSTLLYTLTTEQSRNEKCAQQHVNVKTMVYIHSLPSFVFLGLGVKSAMQWGIYGPPSPPRRGA